MSIDRLFVSRIHYDLTVFSRNYYKSIIFTQNYYEFTVSYLRIYYQFTFACFGLTQWNFQNWSIQRTLFFTKRDRMMKLLDNLWELLCLIWAQIILNCNCLQNSESYHMLHMLCIFNICYVNGQNKWNTHISIAPIHIFLH